MPEKHEFHRLRMRAQRWAGKRSLLSAVNWLFDVSSDYGWGVRKALVWWFLHWFLMGVVLSIGTGEHLILPDNLSVFFQAVLTSFANAHAFLGLGSEGGYLYEATTSLRSASNFAGLVKTVGVLEAFTGPILLFLVLLVIRNRFRLR